MTQTQENRNIIMIYRSSMCRELRTSASTFLSKRKRRKKFKMTRWMSLQALHCKKRWTVFPSPAGMSLTNSPWPGILKLLPSRESLVSDTRLGTGKSLTFFYSVGKISPLELIVPLIFSGMSIYGNSWQHVPVSLLSSSLRISFRVSVEMYPMHSCQKKMN